MHRQATKSEILGCMARFCWMFGTDWFVETEFGNFHWKDPDYGDGDNTFTFFDGDYQKFKKEVRFHMGRDKGQHNVEKYCGDQIKIVYPQ